jgi:hypothetical protein
LGGSLKAEGFGDGEYQIKFGRVRARGIFCKGQTMDKLLPEKRYKTFDDLPNRVKAAIRRTAPRRNMDSFLNYKIPAQGNRSILDILNEDDSEEGGQQTVINVVMRFLA